MTKSTTKEEKTITAYKGFDENWQCRGFQYEIGKTYEHDGEVELCSSGFHACENPFDVLRFYPLAGSKFGSVSLSGDTDNDERKIVAAKITVNAEISLPDFIDNTVKWLVDKVKASPAATTGWYSPAATTGWSSPAATTGWSSPAAALGKNAKAKASIGGAIVLAEYSANGALIGGCFELIVEGGVIKPDTYYTMKGSKLVEVTE